MEFIHRIPSPVGELTAASDGASITGLWIAGQKHFAATLETGAVEKPLPVFAQLDEWLERYFSGKPPEFTPPLAPRGSEFRQAVWRQLTRIPWGETTTYGAIARALTASGGRNVRPRAVGGAVGRNPISLLIPCHRVTGADSNLTGYAAGIEVKARLLRLEGGWVDSGL